VRKDQQIEMSCASFLTHSERVYADCICDTLEAFKRKHLEYSTQVCHALIPQKRREAPVHEKLLETMKVELIFITPSLFSTPSVLWHLNVRSFSRIPNFQTPK
jgi:hypothetical protein